MLPTGIACAAKVTKLGCESLFTSQALDVVRYSRSGNFEKAVHLFRKIPHSSRSVAVHEAIILACAHVPDAEAAAAVLRSMPQQSVAAVSHVVTAYCRERKLEAAVSLVEGVPRAGLPLDPRIVSHVKRHLRVSAGAESHSLLRVEGLQKGESQVRDHVRTLSARLERVSRAHADTSAGLRAISISSAGFFDETGGDCEVWTASRLEEHARSLTFVDAVSRSDGVHRSNSNDTSSSGITVHVENDLIGNFCALQEYYSSMKTWDSSSLLNTALSRIIPGYLTCGKRGSGRALDVLADCFAAHVSSERDVAVAKMNTVRVAQLLTTATATLAACASSAPEHALATYDALSSMDVKGFRTSLPLSGAYFNVLRNAKLPLVETLHRIREVRKYHVQLDERSFTMAVSAILNSSGPANEKWEHAKCLTSSMQVAGVRPTLHTFHAFAKQLRHLNNPEMASLLLRDMATQRIRPTAWTFSLIFDSCIIPGTFQSEARRIALPAQSLLHMLRAIEDHMLMSGVSHSSASRLSLARAYAHLGQTAKALHNFNLAIAQLKSSGFQAMPNFWRLREGDTSDDRANARTAKQFHVLRAYNYVMYNFAHGRCSSPESPMAAFTLFEQLLQESIVPDTFTMEILLDCAVRVGCTRRGLEAISQFTKLQTNEGIIFNLRTSGIENIFCILARTGTVSAWKACRGILEQSISRARLVKKSDNKNTLSANVVELAILAFARNHHRDICNDIIGITGIAPDDWEMNLTGFHEFQRFRLGMERRIRSKNSHVEDECRGENLHDNNATLPRNAAADGVQLSPHY